MIKEFNGKEFKSFKVIDIFDRQRGTRYKKEQRNFGKYPLVTAGDQNNGVASFVDNSLNNKVFQDAITWDMFGSAFYQEGQFICDDNIIVLLNKNLTVYSGLFITNILRMSKWRFGFGRQLRLDRTASYEISLPINAKGDIDWDFMDSFMREREMYSKISKKQLEYLIENNKI